MKKLATLAALAALALPVIAAEEVVTSSNVVGYQKIALSEGFNLVGLQFTKIGGMAKDLSTFSALDDTFDGYDDDYKFTSRLRTWDKTNQEYGYYGWAGTSGTDVDDDPSLDNTWTDMEAYAVNESIDAGEAVWVIVPHAGTLLVSGEVASSDGSTITKNLSAGLNMIANPFPCAVPVSTFGVLDSSYEGYDEDYKFSCRLRTWDVENQEYGYYGWAGTSGTNVDDDPTLDNTWTDMEAYAVQDMIAPGAAVWIIVPHAGTITFTKPASNN